MGWLDDAWQDVRYAARSLRRTPAFTSAAVLTLALGIGATTAIYSVVDSILLQPLPYAGSDRLVRVFENIPFIDAGRPSVQRGVTYQEFLEWRTRTRTLIDTTAVIGMAQRTARSTHGPALLWGAMTSSTTFSMLGAHPFMGRLLRPDDDTHPDVVVLSFETWRRVLQADPDVVGTTIELRGSDVPARVMTVVGVLPVDFDFLGVTDFYTPIALDPARRSPFVAMVGRLAAGASLATAGQEANQLGNAIRPARAADAPPLTVARFEVQILKERLVRPLRPALRVLLAAVVVVLLLVCANVANLLLARGAGRQREIAVRVAVGASRGRIVQLVMAESMVLAAAGGALGALVGAGGVTLVKRLATIDAPGIFRLVFGATLLPRANEVGVNWRVLAIALGTAALTSLLFGVLPALHLSRRTRLEAMGSRGGSSGGRGESRMRSALAVAQLVMATMLLVGAGLLIRSFALLTSVETGFDPSHVLAAQLIFPADYSIERKAETIDRVLTAARAIPGVEAAGFSRAGILIGEELVVGVFVPPGRTFGEMRAAPVKPRVRSVSDGYLKTMGVRTVAGRQLAASDNAAAPIAVLLNRTAARLLFGSASPVGQPLDWHAGAKGPVVPTTVVGVVDDVRNTTPDRDAFAEAFVDYRQLLAVQQKWGDSVQQQDTIAIGFLSFAIRTRVDPAAAIPVFERAVHAVDANAGIESTLPMTQLVAGSLTRQRFYAVMLSVFAAVAGILAAIGIYGVLAYGVVQRTREIGIRMALGAQRAQVLGFVLRAGAWLTTIGIVLGLAAAAAGGQLLQGLLFGITPLDPQTFVVVSLLFGAVATTASYLPARRATRVDPMIALRSE